MPTPSNLPIIQTLGEQFEYDLVVNGCVGSRNYTNNAQTVMVLMTDGENQSSINADDRKLQNGNTLSKLVIFKLKLGEVISTPPIGIFH